MSFGFVFRLGAETQRQWSYAGRYLPVRSRCLQPGQQQGRRWPSSSSSWVRRMRRSRVVACLASSTQQMNSLRAKGVMSSRHRVPSRWRSAPYAGPQAVYAPPHRAPFGRSQADGSEPLHHPLAERESGRSG